MFLGARRQRALATAGVVLEAALGDDIEATLPVARITSSLPAGTATGAAPARFARAQARQDHRRTAGVDRRRDPGIDAEVRRHHHALPVEGGGDASDTLAAAARSVATTRMSVSARSAIRIAQRSFGLRPAGLELAGRQQRAFDMRAPERCVTGSLWLAAIASAMAVAGRRAAAAAVEPAQAVLVSLGSRSSSSGIAAAAAMTNETISPMARASGGSAIHRPAQDSARKQTDCGGQRGAAPATAAPTADRRARAEAPAPAPPAGGSRSCVLFVQTVQKPLRRSGFTVQRMDVQLSLPLRRGRMQAVVTGSAGRLALFRPDAIQPTPPQPPTQSPPPASHPGRASSPRSTTSARGTQHRPGHHWAPAATFFPEQAHGYSQFPASRRTIGPRPTSAPTQITQLLHHPARRSRARKKSPSSRFADHVDAAAHHVSQHFL